MWNKKTVLLLLTVLLFASCYHRRPAASEALVSYSDRQLDSLSFYTSHHYTDNFNFVVRADSLRLLRQQPEELLNDMPTDSFTVGKGSLLVVADIRTLPTDSIDSVWVQLATEDMSFGWTHEKSLLPAVDPDDPISQFISVFSDVHLLIFLVIITLIAALYVIRKVSRHNVKMVHLNDIPSFYPTALLIIVAVSATLYATLQHFAPEMWRHFYFHPTLNPFGVPPLLGIFLASVWAMLIVGLAATDEVRHLLPPSEAVLYLLGLLAAGALLYLIFSVTTLYYIGYLLLVAYVFLAVKVYFRRYPWNPPSENQA